MKKFMERCKDQCAGLPCEPDVSCSCREWAKEKPKVIKASKFQASQGRRLYLAYGSNLHKASMRIRCPNAKPLGFLMLTQARLVFRSVADIEHDPNGRVPVGVWSITREDEKALDRYEGVGIGMYDKNYVPVGEQKALVYMMRDRGIAPPGQYYLNIIRRGYRDFGIDESYLDAALDHSFSNKAITDQITTRREKHPERHGQVARERLPKLSPQTRLIKKGTS